VVLDTGRVGCGQGDPILVTPRASRWNAQRSLCSCLHVISSLLVLAPVFMTAPRARPTRHDLLPPGFTSCRISLRLWGRYHICDQLAGVFPISFLLASQGSRPATPYTSLSCTPVCTQRAPPPRHPRAPPPVTHVPPSPFSVLHPRLSRTGGPPRHPRETPRHPRATLSVAFVHPRLSPTHPPRHPRAPSPLPLRGGHRSSPGPP